MEYTRVTLGFSCVEFGYFDSGAPPNDDYFTLIIIHGHTYHTGTFSPMLEAANSLGYRVILPRRRTYAGSTPYTKEETDALEPTNPPEVVANAYLKQGEYLLRFVDNMIKEHNLKKVILTGWSLGSFFLSPTVCAITTVEEEIRVRLSQTVKTLVWMDPPATVHGIPDPPSGGWIPLYDQSLTHEQRGQQFGHWVTQYYPHPDLDKKDCFKLIYKLTTPVRPGTYSDMPIEELLTKIDLTAGVKGDDSIAGEEFQEAGTIIRNRAFFNADTRKAWGTAPLNIIYGEQNPWPIIWAIWYMEEQSEKTGFPINFKSMPGLNHYGMHDNTNTLFDTISSLVY